MLNKKIIMLLLIIGILTVSFVSATDNISNDVVSTDNYDGDIISADENISSDIINTKPSENNVSEFNQDMLSGTADNKLGDNTGYYSQLSNKIQNAEPGSVVYLTQNYTYGSSGDEYYGVLIDKPLTIEGNGITIDGSQAGSIFRITADNVTINNINFKTYPFTYGDYSGGNSFKQGIAIDWKGCNGLLNNVNYLKSGDSYYSKYEILIKMDGDNNTISNLKITSKNFKHTTKFYSDDDGDVVTHGLIYLKGNDNVIKNSNLSYINIESIFTGDHSVSATRYGGIISIEGDRVRLINNSINNNHFKAESSSESTTRSYWDKITSVLYGGIVYWNGNNGKLINSTFNNNRIASDANPYYYQEYGYSTLKGGVIYWEGNANIFNSIFDSNYASTIAHNYDTDNRMTINSLSAQTYGGALYVSSSNGFNSIMDSKFSNNYITSKYYKVGAKTSTEYKGTFTANAVYLNISSGKVYNSIFDCNSDPDENYHAPNLVFDGNLNISHCIFSNQKYYDYVMECYGLESNINYNIFLNNVYKIQSSSKKINVDYNWWGSDSNPQSTISGVVCNNWICSNLYVNETFMDEPIIYNKLNKLSDGTLLSDEDYAKLPVRNVTYSFSGYGSLSSTKSDTVNGISYLNDNSGSYEVKITSTVDNQVTEITKVLNISKFQEGSFTDLQNLIENTNSNILNLEKNYTYVSFDDRSMQRLFNYNAKEGIVINKKLIINGNGFTINGLNLARIFNILADNVTLNNMTLINSSSEDVYWNAKEGILSNSLFNNIYIDSKGNVSLINNKEFKNSIDYSVLVKGGVYLQNNSFINFIDVSEGGSIYSKIHTNILGGETKYLLPGDIDIDAVISDDNSNIIKVTDLKFVSGVNNYKSIFNNGNYISSGFILNNSETHTFTITTTSNLIDNDEISGKIISKLVDINVNLNYDSIKYKESIIATINMASSVVTGSISILIDGNKFKEFNIDGNDIIIELNDLEIGKHNISAVYDGEDNYIATSTTKNIVVNKWDVEITTKNYTITYSDDLIVEVIVSDEIVTGNITLTVNKQTYTENISNSKALFKIPVLNAGSYEFSARYNGNQYYNSDDATGLITINKFKNFNMESIVPTEITYGDLIKIEIKFDKNLTGEVSFKINDIDYLESVTDGKATFNLNNLDAKTYSITPVYSGDNNYESKIITTNFIIDKADSTVNVTVKNNIIYGENATVIITTNVDGKVRVKVANFDKTIPVIGKEAIIEIPYLNANEDGYSVEAIFSDDNNNYKNSNGNGVLKVFKENPIFNININDVNYNDLTSIYGTFASDIDGYANITLSDNQGVKLSLKNIIISNGAFNQELNNLNASKYTLTFEYGGNGNYNSTKLTKTFNVFKIDPDIDIQVINATYGQPAKIIVNSNVEGNVTINVGSIKIYNEILITDMIIQDVNDIDAGTYSIKVTYNGNNNFNTKTFSADLKINKALANVVATVEDIIYSEFPTINIKSTVDGSIIVKIDNNHIKNINIISNTITPVSFEDNIPVGKHNVSVVLKSSNNYNETVYDTDFIISKKPTSITFNVADVVYGEDVIINVTASEDGKITLTVGDIVREKDVLANTMTKFNLGTLSAKTHSLNINLDAGNNYKLDNKHTDFVVSPALAEINEVQVTNSSYGEKILVNVKTNVGGVVTVKMGNIIKILNVSANKLTLFDLGISNAGLYSVDVNLDAGDNYTHPSAIKTIKINPKETNVNVNVKNCIYGENVIINVTSTENGLITVKLGEFVKQINIEANKSTSIDFGVVDSNSYYVDVNLNAGSNFKNSTAKDSIIISKANTILTIDNPNINYGETAIIEIISNHAGTGILKVGNMDYLVDLKNGLITKEISGLNSDIYSISIQVNDSKNYNGNSTFGILTVNKANSCITSSTFTTVYNGGKYLIATLTDNQGNSIVGASVSINLNGVKSFITDDNGQVKILTNNLIPKIYATTISFKGNVNYEKSTATVKVIVKKATPKITAKSKTFKKSVKIKKYTITLKNNLNKVIKNSKVTIKVNKKTYSAKTNSKGVATFKITKLTKKGTFKSIITYKGDKYYNKVTKNVNIKVK